MDFCVVILVAIWQIVFPITADKNDIDLENIDLENIRLCSPAKQREVQKVVNPRHLLYNLCAYRNETAKWMLCFAGPRSGINLCRLERCPKKAINYVKDCDKKDLKQFAIDQETKSDDDDEEEEDVPQPHKVPFCPPTFESMLESFEPKAQVMCWVKKSSRGICFIHYLYVACRMKGSCPEDYEKQSRECKAEMLEEASFSSKYPLCGTTEEPDEESVRCIGKGVTGCYIYNEKKSELKCRYSGFCPDDNFLEPCSELDSWKACSSNPCPRGTICVDVNTGGKKDFTCSCEEVGKDPETGCQVDCKHPFWGPGCKNEVGACATTGLSIVAEGINTFDHRTGCTRCAEGISDPPYCTKADCDRVVCRNNAKCNNNKCQCVVGWTGALCEEPYKSQLANLDWCNDTQLCNGHSCVLVDDKPVCRCKEDKVGDKCQYSCLPRTEVCHYGKCDEDKCVCDDGYKGKRCQKTCREGSYGPKCKETCGNCVIYPCHHSDGHCKATPDGRSCIANYKPPLCTDWDSSKDADENPYQGWLDINAPWTNAYNIITTNEFKDASTALKDYLKLQLNRLRVLIDILSEIDVTFHPARRRGRRNTGSKGFFTGRRHRRQVGDGPGVRAVFVLILPDDAVTDANFEEKLVSSMRENADQFDKSGKYTIDADSIRLKTVKVDTSTRTRSAMNWTPVAVTVMLASAVALVVIIVVKWRRTASHRRWQQRNTRLGPPMPLAFQQRSQRFTTSRV